MMMVAQIYSQQRNPLPSARHDHLPNTHSKCEILFYPDIYPQAPKPNIHPHHIQTFTHHTTTKSISSSWFFLRK